MDEKNTDTIAQQIKDFFCRFPSREFSEGQVIVYPGDDPPGIMYIQTGIIGQFDISKNGSRIGVNSFKPGAFCPMSWAINQTPNRYYFEALTDLSVRITPRDATVEWLKQNPHILYDLLSRVYRGLDGLLDQHTILLGSNARAKVLFSVILQARRYGKSTDDGRIRVDATESYLAELAGVSRETVSRQLQELKSRGTINISRGVIEILSLKNLEAELLKER